MMAFKMAFQWFARLVGCFLTLLMVATVSADSLDELNDGPYIRFLQDDSLVAIQWICRGEAYTQVASVIEGRLVPVRCHQRWPIYLAEQLNADPQTEFEAQKVAVIADIHGQFELATTLLKAHHIIDDKFEWQFGQNHLVVLGDMMGRGAEVTELLWFLYELEQQAKRAGGRVHVMIGNHESMVMQGDIRFANQKYQRSSLLLKQQYQDLFDTSTLLGRWLRTKPVMLKINNMLMVHAGVHPDLLLLQMNMAEINQRFNDTLGITRSAAAEEPDLAFLYGRYGPLWLRQYFAGDEALPFSQLKTVLHHFGVEHIVVGHTSFDKIYMHYNGHVISVDSDLKRGVSGELFFWDNQQLWRGTKDGKLRPITHYKP
ncbi:metallophosphoesterase [Alkalimonas delamerensis]|uniref:Metallophosphoesterase n=1 Tax=Alkalimonas delamerensis TaxID=265981 RepID=A0ABT9GT97_9GAMM|nr:metallophosphoesterase [Alkalimonas delamerensis]MDP4529856.1 metallophosphoesterase [Alkalimonas delamerensis]